MKAFEFPPLPYAGKSDVNNSTTIPSEIGALSLRSAKNTLTERGSRAMAVSDTTVDEFLSPRISFVTSALKLAIM